MAPAASKSKSYSNPVATQSDDAKYRTKYKELKGKVLEIEEDNNKLSVKILKSKKAIQRLRIERAILYDRLHSTVAPTNPYSLSSAARLSSLASSSDPSAAPSAPPPSILATPSYPLADPSAPDLFRQQLNAQTLAATSQHAANGSGASATAQHGAALPAGVKAEGQGAMGISALLAGDGPSNGTPEGGLNGQGGAAYGGAFAPPGVLPPAVPHPESALQVDQA